jgi:hypothetical protein
MPQRAFMVRQQQAAIPQVHDRRTIVHFTKILTSHFSKPLSVHGGQ